MTTLIALFLTVSMLAGCAGAPATDVKHAAVTPPVLSATMSQPAPLRYTVETETRTDAVLAEDGTELLRYTFAAPKVVVWRGDGSRAEQPENPAEETAMAKAEVFNSQFENWIGQEDIEELAAAAGEDLAWHVEEGQPWYGPYELELTCSVYRTDRLISVTGEYYSNTGGAHPNTCLLAWNFDLVDGVFLTPERLAEDSQAFLETVQAEIVRQCRVVAADIGAEPEDCFWSNYEEIAADWSSYAVSFGEMGMTVAFSPYELACYAAGPQIFTLPYELLEPSLSEYGLELLGLNAA